MRKALPSWSSWVVGVIGVSLCACHSSPATTDGGIAADGGDAATPVDTGPVCASNADCDDHVFCNGAERCAPGDPAAAHDGCAPPLTPTPCATGERCDEMRDLCSACVALDADGDGVVSFGCGGTDCDDADPHRFPGNAEICDATGHDEDCDPCTVASPTTGDGDLDFDGWISAMCTNAFIGATPACDAATTRIVGMLVTGADCADADPAVHPSHPETCNGVDDDCNGLVDDGVLLSFWPDVDMDGYGATSAMPVLACTAPAGTAANSLDCNDTNLAINPVATETCNGVDDDCNGLVDDGASTTVYRDADGDGHGDPTMSMPITSCTAPTGFVRGPADDCNDTAGAVFAGAPELCDGLDDDCSLTVGAGGPDPTEDRDGDHHAPVGASCTGGFPANDCDETSPLVFGGALERCDGVDDDCDGTVDGPAATAFCGADSTCTAGVCVDHVGLALGDDNACAITSTGTAVCWGEDDFDQLGDGPRTSTRYQWQAHPVDVLSLTDLVELAPMGPRQTCARRRDGTVACWGEDVAAQPVDVAGVTGAVQLAGSCARRVDGTVTCWALDLVPFDAGLTNVVDLVGTVSETCVRLESGVVQCWGQNDSGQLGDGTTTASSGTPVNVLGLVGTAVQLAGGDAHACARMAAGTVYCWGSNSSGQLGDGTLVDRHTAVAVSGLGDAVDVTAFGVETCARHADGTLACWGGNASGQLGDGTSASRGTVAAVSGLGAVLGVRGGSNAMGAVAYCGGTQVQEVCGNAVDEDCDGVLDDGCRATACARAADGSVSCWGSDFGGQLGDGNRLEWVVTPEDIVGLTGVVEVEAGLDHACARRGDGTVSCWGSDYEGVLGLHPAPRDVAGIADAAKVAVGGDLLDIGFTCVLHTDGTVSCWGDGSRGQLGDGTTTTRATPAPVAGIAGATDLVAGRFQACAITGGTVLCWGGNDLGQLGDGTFVDSATPVAVSGLVDAVELAAGSDHVCARRAAGGEVVCWGSGGRGQLGDGLSTTSSVPVSTGLTGVLGIGAGMDDSCAVAADRTGLCWGSGMFFQLARGVRSRADAPTPIAMVGMANAAEMTNADGVSCGLTTSSEVECWGGYALAPNGGIGDGYFTIDPTRTGSVIVATPILLPSDASDIDGGFGLACAVHAAGHVACWGYNDEGALGTGARDADRVRPFVVPGIP